MKQNVDFFLFHFQTSSNLTNPPCSFTIRGLDDPEERTRKAFYGKGLSLRSRLSRSVSENCFGPFHDWRSTRGVSYLHIDGLETRMESYSSGDRNYHSFVLYYLFSLGHQWLRGWDRDALGPIYTPWSLYDLYKDSWSHRTVGFRSSISLPSLSDRSQCTLTKDFSTPTSGPSPVSRKLPNRKKHQPIYTQKVHVQTQEGFPLWPSTISIETHSCILVCLTFTAKTLIKKKGCRPTGLRN